MIKLVTQFDNEKSKLSLATPTCGCCCCCCCCCIVSTFAAASISARSFGKLAAKELPNEPKKIKIARRFGFWLPIGLLVCLGLGLWFAGTYQIHTVAVLILSGIIYLTIMIYLLKRKVNLLYGVTTKVILNLFILIIIETIGFFVGMYALLLLGWIYLAVAVTISILLICWAFGKKYDNLEKLKNSDNVDNIDNIENENSFNKQADEVIDNTQALKIDNDNLNDKSVVEKSSKRIQLRKKKCLNCGVENAIENKRCIYCANFFEEDDKK